MARLTGFVKFFQDTRGYGFIVPDDGPPEVFVHRKDFAPGLLMLLTNQRVRYDLVDAGSHKGNGKKAANVELII